MFFINLRLYILIIFCIFTNLFKIKNDNVMKNLMIFSFMITSLLGFSQSSISFVKHISADFDRLAQLVPGTKIRFQEVSLAEAEKLFEIYNLETNNLVNQII